MKGICSIVLDKDKVFLAFACKKGKSYFFLKEEEIIIPFENNDIIKFLNSNISLIDKKIRESEKNFSFKTEELYLQSPWELTNARSVNDTIPFQKKQKVTSKVVSQAKKYLEDKFLDWDEQCLHHIIFDYYLEGQKQTKVPLGMVTRKLGLNSFIFSVKNNVYREIEGAFENIDRDFTALIAPQIGIFCSVPLKPQLDLVAVSMGYEKTYFVAKIKNCFYFDKGFDFGQKDIIQALAEKFMITPTLADEVFRRYASFRETPYSKEITIKKEDSYLQVSTQSLNIFLKDFIKNNIADIIEKIKEKTSKADFILSFVGRLNEKEGFYNFLREILGLEIIIPIQASAVSSALGCLDYGFYRHFEKILDNNAPFLQRIVNTYHEYF